MPDFQAAYETYGDKVLFVMLNVTTWEDAQIHATTYIQGQGFTFPVYFDITGEAVGAYGVTSIPRTYFISTKGALVKSFTGMIDEATLETWIQYLLA